MILSLIESLNEPDSLLEEVDGSRSITESRLAGFPNNVKATYDPAEKKRNYSSRSKYSKSHYLDYFLLF